jgi:hypothetical protein
VRNGNSGRWIGEEKVWSNICLWSDLNNSIYVQKPKILQNLRYETEIVCPAIEPATTPAICHSVVFNDTFGLMVDVLKIC